MLGTSLVDDKHTFALHPCLFLLRSQFIVLNGNAITFTKSTYSLRKSHSFMLHQEANSISTFTASETVPRTTCRIHHKTGCLLLVERTASYIIDTFLLQLNITGYHVHNVGTIQNLFYNFFVYHCIYIFRYYLLRMTVPCSSIW